MKGNLFVSLKAICQPVEPEKPTVFLSIRVITKEGKTREPAWRQDEKGDWWFPVEEGDTLETFSAIPSPETTFSFQRLEKK